MKRWKSCSGYVNIDIVGKYPEKAVNRLTCEGMKLENVTRTDNGLAARMRAAEFIGARRLFRGCGCRVRIIEKSLLARMRSRLRASRVFLVALAVFAAVCAALLTRVWFIEVNSVSIGEQSIMRVLREQGVSRGCSVSKVDNIALSRALMRLPGAVNAKITLRGVTLGVEIAESVPGVGISSRESSGGIYADRDCVISFISVTSGRALVGKGSAVKKGDLLISGDLSELKEGFVVPAAGVIEGEVLHAVSANAPRMRTSLVRTGRTCACSAAKVLGSELKLPPPYERFELEMTGEKCLSGCPIPVGVIFYDCFELKERSVPDTAEGTELRARLAAQDKLKNELPCDASIKTIETDIIINADGSVTARITAITKERIGINR